MTNKGKKHKRGDRGSHAEENSVSSQEAKHVVVRG